MTTISTSTPMMQTGSGSAAQGNSLSAQITRLTQQITKLIQQLKDISSSEGDPDVKRKQQEQLAQLQHQQAEEALKKQDQSSVKGIDALSNDHQIDVYV